MYKTLLVKYFQVTSKNFQVNHQSDGSTLKPLVPKVQWLGACLANKIWSLNFRHSISITHHSSLITYHSIFHIRLPSSLNFHHSLFFTLFGSPRLWRCSFFFSFSFFFFSVPRNPNPVKKKKKIPSEEDRTQWRRKEKKKNKPVKIEPSEEEREKKKKPMKKTEPMRKKKKKKSQLFKICGWVGLSCVFNYKNAIEL